MKICRRLLLLLTTTALFGVLTVFMVYASYSLEFRYTQKKAVQGDAEAQTMMAKMHLEGRGTPQNIERGIACLTQAAEREEVEAQTLLGSLYRNGKGLPKDLPYALMWLNLAAAQGDRTARQERAALLRLMPQEDIDEGNRLAREWAQKRQKR